MGGCVSQLMLRDTHNDAQWRAGLD